MMEKEVPKFVPPDLSKPKNTWDLLRWVYEEIVALDYFIDKIKNENWIFLLINRTIIFVKFAWVSLLLWAIIWNIIIFFNHGITFSPEFIPDYLIRLQSAPTFFARYFFTIESIYLTFLITFSIGLIFSNALPGLIFGFILGFLLSLKFTIVDELVGGIIFGTLLGFIQGFLMHLLGEFPTIDFNKAKTSDHILIGIVFCAVFSLLVGNAYGRISGITFGIVFFSTLYNPVYHLLYSFQWPIAETVTLINQRGRFWLIGTKRRKFLEQNALQSLDWILAFCAFLFEYRKMLQPFAVELLLKAYASKWVKEPLNADVLKFPTLPQRIVKYEKVKFIKATESLRQKLIKVGQDQNDIRRLSGYKEALERLNEVKLAALSDRKTLSLINAEGWVRDYQKAIDVWIKACSDKITTLEQDIHNRLPYGSNPFFTAKPLSPQNGRELFRGRKNVSDQLSRRITGTRELPMLLIQGQRRVGKTSLISFLETLLDRRFVVVKQDMQQGGLNSIEEWMKDLRLKINLILKYTETEVWQCSGNWGKDWAELGAHIQNLADAQELRVILAIDEYERLHTLLRQRSENEALDLLGAMRSYTQHQNRVILLFAGLLDFSDLKSPDWTGIFVQRERIRVDYLNAFEAKDLIEHPVPSFPITYADGVVAEIVQLTQGQPALLQEIGSHLFNQASQKQKPHISMEALRDCIQGEILVRGNQVMEVFWTGFCADSRYKKAVNAIIETGQCADQPVVLRLEDYGFIIKQTDGNFKMRVPLFEEWVKRFAGFYED